jgi:hypothetical protein
MAGRKMRANESAAAEIVAAYLDGKPEPRDVERAPDKTHDFDVVLRTGQRLALEVTAVVDEARVRFDHAAFGKDWIAPTLAHDWWVVFSRRTVQPSTRVYHLMKQLVPLLEVMERDKVVEIDRDGLRTPRHATRSELLRAHDQFVTLGGSLARSHGPRRSSSGGQVLLSFSHGFSADPGLANALVVAARGVESGETGRSRS